MLSPPTAILAEGCGSEESQVKSAGEIDSQTIDSQMTMGTQSSKKLMAADPLGGPLVGDFAYGVSTVGAPLL